MNKETKQDIIGFTVGYIGIIICSFIFYLNLNFNIKISNNLYAFSIGFFITILIGMAIISSHYKKENEKLTYLLTLK
jgi:hypothetical protein